MTTDFQRRHGSHAFRVFLSYRREDASGHAGRLYDAITAQFRPENVFMDIDSIEPGVDFVEVVEQAVGSCDVLLALIGKQWLQATDKTGAPRLHNEHDYVRLEVEAALDRGIRVIPVLVQDSHMPRSEELPSAMRGLARRNAIGISDHRWHYDVEQLLHLLERLSQASNSDSSIEGQTSAQSQTATAKSDRGGTLPPYSSVPNTGTATTEWPLHSTADERGPRDSEPARGSSRARLWWTIGAIAASTIVCLALLAVLVFSKHSSTAVGTPTEVSIDGFVTVTGAGSQTTPGLHTSKASDLLVAMVSTEYEQQIVVGGDGLAWAKVSGYSGTISTGGQDIEIWTAQVKLPTANLTVTSSMSGPSPWFQSLTVMAFHGASGLGATSSACYSSSGCTSKSPTPRVLVTPKQTGSMILGVGYDYSDNLERFAPSGQSIDQQAYDLTQRTAMWVQHAVSRSAAGTPVIIRDSVAPNDNWALTAFEVEPRHP